MSATWRDDKFHDECGLFGIWNHAEAANVTYLGLYALQHRGQESAGIAATDGHDFHRREGDGLGGRRLQPRAACAGCPATAPSATCATPRRARSNLRNAQPITATFARGPIAIAHNGNLINAEALRKDMERDGAIFQSTSDTEVILHLLARARRGRWRSRSRGRWPRSRAPTPCSSSRATPSTRCATATGSARSRWAGWASPGSLASETCALDLMEASTSATSSRASWW